MSNEEFVRYLLMKEDHSVISFYVSKVWDGFFKKGFSLNLKNPFQIFKGNYSYQDYHTTFQQEPMKKNIRIY